jgi:hypothetical protein
MQMSEVYKAIAAVTAALSRDGISKSRKNTGQGYNFRGIDDIYNALSGELATAQLCIIPRVIERDVAERQSKAGAAMFYVTVKAEYDIVSAKDGSTHTACAYGEAMDSGDKATNKAMSAAYKYMAEGDNDADASTHEVKANPTTDEAKQRFFTRYGDAIKGTDWESVQRFLKSRAPQPTTVDGWIAAAEAVRAMQKPTA